MTRDAHIPIRQCVGCRSRRPQREMVRTVLAGGEAAVDVAGTRPGRGAYLCAEKACLTVAIKRRAFERALRTKNVNLDAVARHLADAGELRPGA